MTKMEKKDFLKVHEEFWDNYSKNNLDENKLINRADYNFLGSVNAKYFPIPTDTRDFFLKFNNEINEFYLGIFRMRTWAKMLEAEKLNKDALILSYLNPLTHSLLSYPYIFKNRIAFCLSSLIHDLEKIFFDDFNKSFNQYSIKVSTITGNGDNSLYIDLASDLDLDISPVAKALEGYKDSRIMKFRHAWNHRFPQNIELGYSKHIARLENNGNVVYGFGGGKPLKILEIDDGHEENLVDLLLKEHDKILKVFNKYWTVNQNIFKLING